MTATPAANADQNKEETGRPSSSSPCSATAAWITRAEGALRSSASFCSSARCAACSVIRPLRRAPTHGDRYAVRRYRRQSASDGRRLRSSNQPLLVARSPELAVGRVDRDEQLAEA